MDSAQLGSASGCVQFPGRQLIKMSVGAGPRLTEREEAQTIHFLSEEEKGACFILKGSVHTNKKILFFFSQAELPFYIKAKSKEYKYRKAE